MGKIWVADGDAYASVEMKLSLERKVLKVEILSHAGALILKCYRNELGN